MDIINGIKEVIIKPYKLVGLGITVLVACLGIKYHQRITLLVPVLYIVYQGYMASCFHEDKVLVTSNNRIPMVVLENRKNSGNNYTNTPTNAPKKLEKKTTVTTTTTETIYFDT